MAETTSLDEIRLSPKFKLVFLSVLALTVLSMIVSVLIATLNDPPSDSERSLIEAFGTTWRMGFGAIIGLIGAKQI